MEREYERKKERRRSREYSYRRTEESSYQRRGESSHQRPRESSHRRSREPTYQRTREFPHRRTGEYSHPSHGHTTGDNNPFSYGNPHGGTEESYYSKYRKVNTGNHSATNGGVPTRSVSTSQVLEHKEPSRQMNQHAAHDSFKVSSVKHRARPQQNVVTFGSIPDSYHPTIFPTFGSDYTKLLTAECTTSKASTNVPPYHWEFSVPNATSSSESGATGRTVLETATGNQDTSSTSPTSATLLDEAMLTEQQQRQVFEREDIRLFRLRKIFDTVVKEVMYQVFCEDTKARPFAMKLFEFYEDKRGVQISKFKSCLDKMQIKLIESNPEGNQFDVTLLYKCLSWGSSILEKKEHKIWKEGNESLESNLTAIKNRRNIIFHSQSCPDSEFTEKLEDCRQLLWRIIELAGVRYEISKTDVEKQIADMNNDINLIRDKSLIPPNIDEYKNQNLYSELVEMVKKEGRPLLEKLYDSWVIVTPVSYFYKSEIKFRVDVIFTEMVLKGGESSDNKQTFEDILTGIHLQCNDPIILIEGIAGAGKTTLTKKILGDWTAGKSSMNSLTIYDLLLYTECRNKSIKSFKGLIQSLMPQIATRFQDEDLVNVILNLKVLLIIDGLDELNATSTSLFQEILDLKKSYNLTVLATTRPEKVNYYFEVVDSLHTNTKHIKLIGITKEKRNEFVIKYHDEMVNLGFSNQDIKCLLEYLEKTAIRLSDIWMLPLNLVFLIILFVDDPENVLDITTAPELYWKIHQMILKKLKERLFHKEMTPALSDDHERDKRIDNFRDALCEEALLGLQTDDINLTKDAYKRLVKVCDDKSIPPDEMIGAFLKKIVIRSPKPETKHSFPHKGLQEFLGALKIFREICARTQKKNDAQKDFAGLCKEYNFPTEPFMKLLEDLSLNPLSIPSQLGDEYFKSTIIRDHLNSVHGTTNFDITKYQNLIVTLIGMFFLENHETRDSIKLEIRDSIKLEALELLRDTGLTECIDWLRVLMAVKYDAFVAKFLSTLPWVRKGVIKIDQVDLITYISILKAIEKLPQELKHMTIDLYVQGEFLELEEMLKIIKHHQFKVNHILITELNLKDYKNSLEILPSVLTQDHQISVAVQHDSLEITNFLHLINERNFNVKSLKFNSHFKDFPTDFPSKNEIISVLNRGKIEVYQGTYISKTKIPASVMELEISVSNSEDLPDLKEYFESGCKTVLKLSFAPGVNFTVLSPTAGILCLYLPNLNGSNYLQAYGNDNALKMPKRKKKLKYWRILFPNCSLNLEETSTLISHLGAANMTVTDRLFFSKKLMPTVPDEKELNEKVKGKLGSKFSLSWELENQDAW